MRFYHQSACFYSFLSFFMHAKSGVIITPPYHQLKAPSARISLNTFWVNRRP